MRPGDAIRQQELLEERSKNRMALSRLSEVKDKYESKCEV